MTNSFIIFSEPHLIGLVAFILISLLLFLFRSHIKNNFVAKNVTRYTLIILLALSEITLDVWNITEGFWNIKYTLPLELCSITLLLSIVLLFTRNHLLYQILFFTGIGGALQALITPNLDYAFPHFRFYQFFTAHILIILASLYMTWVENYKPNWKSILWTMIFLNITALLVGIADYALGSNYMFLMHKPSTASILDILGPYPYYLLSEEGIALLIFVLMYLIFFVLPAKYSKAARVAKAHGRSIG